MAAVSPGSEKQDCVSEGRGRGRLGAVVVVMALRSGSRVPLTSCGRMRRGRGGGHCQDWTSAERWQLLRQDQEDRLGVGWGGVGWMLIKTRLDGPGGESECQRGHKIVPSEGKGHQSVSDSSEEESRRSPLTFHHDVTHHPQPLPPPKTRGVAYVASRA